MVDFGIGLRRMDSVAEDAARAEALGYTFVSTGEHVFFYGPIGNGLDEHVDGLGQLMELIGEVNAEAPAHTTPDHPRRELS